LLGRQVKIDTCEQNGNARILPHARNAVVHSGFVVMCGLKDVEIHFSGFPQSHDTVLLADFVPAPRVCQQPCQMQPFFSPITHHLASRRATIFHVSLSPWARLKLLFLPIRLGKRQSSKFVALVVRSPYPCPNFSASLGQATLCPRNSDPP
jgi:hypothetical protein